MNRVKHICEQVMGRLTGEGVEKLLLAHETAHEQFGSEKYGSLRELIIPRSSRRANYLNTCCLLVGETYFHSSLS